MPKISEKCLQTTKVPINIDCIKVCPFNKNIFAFAYYQQHPQFVGGIAVKDVSKTPIEFSSMQIFQYGPILHICWVQKQPIDLLDGIYYFVGACRTDRIFIASYHPKNEEIKIVKQIQVQKGMFCLYVDCRLVQNLLHITVSNNDSKVFHLCLDFQSMSFIDQNIYQKHQFAVWACRFNRNASLLACGDQVSTLYFYQPKQKKLIFKNSKIHKQGICDIVFHNQYNIYSCGFDGRVALLDSRKLQQPVHVQQYKGVVWRVIPSSEPQTLLICNSSQNKFIVSQKGQTVWDSKQSHTSLAYAADWNDKTLITASFYDKVVCEWQIK